MKTRFLGWAFIAAMTGLTSCNESESLEQESEIKLTSEIAATRAGTDVQSTAIEENAVVGVNISNVKEDVHAAVKDYTNTKWTVGADGAMTGDKTYYYSLEETKITAYCPYAETYTDVANINFQVQENQSEKANYIASDLLWAEKSGIFKTSSAVELTFAHQLAKIVLILESADGYDLNGAVVSICGTIPTATFNSTDGTVTVTSDGAATPITVGTLTASSSHEIAAIIIPQTVKDTKFLNVNYKNKDFSFKLSSTGKQFEGGHVYKYKLSVDEKDLNLKLKEVEITDWTDNGTETVTADEE